MKKQLVASLAAAMVLGVAGTSFAAANPFSDVPAKHWSYDSVAKLSKAGIVDGYGDGTYKGDKMITRYEMAQVVAKAMARSDKADAAQKAQIDKLAAEFAEELNVLGVRVSNLEKKVGTVKVTGDARIRYTRTDKSQGGAFQERLRVNLNADINENTSVYGRIMNQHNPQGSSTNENLRIANAALTSKNLFNSSAVGTVGRFDQQFDTVGYFLGTTGMVDGAKVSFGNKLKTTVGMADFSQATNGSAPNGGGTATAKIETAAFATAEYKTSKVTTLQAGYLSEVSAPLNGKDFKVYTAGVKTTVAPNVGFTAEYLKNTIKSATTGKAPTGYLARVSYKGVNSQVQGSWGAFVEYYNMKTGMLPSGGNGSISDFATMNMVNLQDNQKAYNLAVSYALAKNVTLDAVQTFETKFADGANAGVKKSNYTRFNVNYMF